MTLGHEPEPEPLDPELLSILRETCKSYQSFLRALPKWVAEKKAEGSLETWTDPGVVGYWLVYLLLLGYDVGFISLAIIAEGLDRQLLTMKRQAFEYAVKAQYLVKFPEKAAQQYEALPLKMREYLKRLEPADADAARSMLLENLEEASRALPPGTGPTYGEVSMFDMMRSVYPEDYASLYARHYWLPSATMHGLQIGILDAHRRLDDGKMWFSHFSLMSNRTENVCVITDSLIRLLLITGDRLELRGTHWLDLMKSYNGVIARISPTSKIINIPVDSVRMKQAAGNSPADKDPG